MSVGRAAGPPAPDPAAVRAAPPSPEIDAVTAASRAASRQRIVARPVPGAGDGFGIALASAVGMRWPARDELARRGETARRDAGSPRGSGRDADAPSAAVASAGHAAADEAPDTLGRAAMRTLVRDVIGASPAAASATQAAATSATADPPAASAPLPDDIAWQIVAPVVAEVKPAPVADEALAGATSAFAALAGSGAAPQFAAAPGDAATAAAVPATAATQSAPSAPQTADRVTVQFGGDDGPAGTVRLSLRGDRVHATIVAPTAAEAETLAHGLDGLRRALHGQGFSGAHVTVQAPRSAAPSSAQSSAHTGADPQTPRDPRRSRDDADARRALRTLHTSSTATPGQEESR